MPATKIGVIVGSLRRDSFNRRMARVLGSIAPTGMELETVEIGNLSLYNQDLDGSPPKEWTALRNRIKAMDGILFVTPEYNRSIPGVLKNAIDIASRPYGQSVWEGKPAAVISVSPGAIGGFGANHHLRQCLVFLNVPCMQQPEAYIGDAGGLFNEQGEIPNEATRRFLGTFVQSFADWVHLHAAPTSQMKAAA
jgi:chromate reductase, NAD(P)H dehydrogenase (quinone)